MKWCLRLFSVGIVCIFWPHFIAAEDCEKDTDFMCRSDGKCIDSKLMCDHKFDCADNSDEEHCDCLEPEWYLCKDNTTCISHNARCDGRYDCPTEDDEEKCEHYVPHHEVTKCTSEEFRCHTDGLCLPLDLVCDGIKQCFDGSDEIFGCTDLVKTCKGFMCKNGHCLSDKSWMCDEVNDCGDNSDEEHCSYSCTLQNEKFLCSDNTTCIPLAKVCDGTKDCPSGSDESETCVAQKKNKTCTKDCAPNGYCTNVPSTGFACVCPKGFQLNEKSQQCEDINECAVFGTCSQGCINTIGSYRCTCAPNFRLLRNGRTCKARGQTDAYLLYAASKSVSWFTLRSKHMKRVAENLNQVIGICFDGDHVYWTDISVQVESIMKAKTDGTELQTLFTAGLGKPEDIAVDYITRNIYFSDNDFQHLAVCSNDGRYCKAIISENVHRPRGIALHPQKGTMYYTDWGIVPMIAVASMDGQFNRPLITDNIHWPNGLALDWPNERLYWVDAKLKTIESCKLDASDRRSVIKMVSKHPYGIAVFQDTLYWSDWDSKSIQSANKFTGKNRTTIIRDSVIYDIHVYHPALQRFGRNPCLESDCSHLCLLNSNNTYTCECPKYMELGVDKHTCRWTGKQKIIVMGIGNRLVNFEHQSFGRHEDGEGKTLKYQIDKMAYNSIKGSIIIADNLRKVIIEVNTKNYAVKELITEHVGNVTALAFDALANNLYWTDAERSTIEVYSFNTQHRAVVQHFMSAETPIALAAITEGGKLFVALRSLAHTHIDMISPNGQGSHFHVLEDELGNGPISMTPDHELQEVFWTDFEQSKISYTDFSGVSHHTFLYDVDNPISIALAGDDLFWSSTKSLKLNWTPKHSFVGTKSMHIEHPFTSVTPMSMQLVAISPKTVSSHTCAEHGFNGGCSHICVAMSKTTHSCLCPSGLVFSGSSNTTCIPHEECSFRCGSGECITEEQRCNGKKDCPDSSDEKNCHEQKKYVTCAPNQFTCLDRLKCIDREQRCDQSFDCEDSSDEKDCKHYDKDTKCHKNQFLCLNGECIDSNNLCDGFKDCSEGEDEVEINCRSSASRTCNENEFKCSNNQCIPNEWRCDGGLDCSDDEENCPPESCTENMKQCDHGMCISKNLWCNGDNDCGDFSDEMNCADWIDHSQIEIVCDDKQFQCKNNKTICLEKSKRCNGFADCPKGEDELDCDLCASDTEFQCDTGECIPIQWRCDNQKDCTNGQDEEGCSNSTSLRLLGHHFHPSCSNKEFKCKNGSCIDWDRVCNGHEDCLDGSDESGNCVTACKNSPCGQRCIPTPNGPVCACHDGYSLNADKTSCEDIDECSDGSYPCSQNCINTLGSYRCTCFVGFALSMDKVSCKSLDGRMTLFYSAYDKIYQLGPHVTQMKSTNGSQIISLDMNFNKQLLYFTVEDSDALYEFNWTDSSKQVSSVKNIGTPTHVAVDWVTDNVYFIDKAISINVCHMYDQQCITLVELKDGEHIKSLTVDAVHRRFFYVTLKKFEFTEPRSTIIAHSLDGSKRQVIAQRSFFISSITCDFYTERIYYVGLDTATVWSVKYDGTGERLMFARNSLITRPIEINLFESHVYISNAGSKTIAKCPIYGEKQCKSFQVYVSHPTNLVIAQKSRQASAENACANNKCNTICTPSDVGAKCICDFGHMVEPGVLCNSVRVQRNQPLFASRDSEVTAGTFSVLGTLSIIGLLIVLVMGGLFVYRRFYAKRNFSISMHFENPRSAMEAARVRMCKLNEIMIHRNNNNKNNNNDNKTNQSNETTPTTMIEEQENMDFSTASTSNDDTQKLLI